MTTSAQSIITEVQNLLQDSTGTRWSSTELLRHLNDGQREVSALRPDMFVVTAAMALTGVKHTLPAACVNLQEIPRNTNGAPIRQVDRSMLDAVEPTWMTKSASTTIKHTCYDAKEPDVFYSYPPAATGASVDLVYSTLPTDALVTGNISCKDTAKAALMHFCLFRAYMKDAEFGGNAALSTAHYQMFKAQLGEDAAVGDAVKPLIRETAQ